MKIGKTATDHTAFTIRPATRSDLSAVHGLASKYDISIIGEPDVDESSFADAWDNPRTRLAEDVRVAEDRAGNLLAYEHCIDPAGNGRIEIEGFVHPEHRGRGIGSTLLRAAALHAEEIRDRLPPDIPHFVRAGTFTRDPHARVLMEEAGFVHVRFFLRMTVRFQTPPMPVTPPEEFTIRALLPGESLKPVHAACDDIFQDHWGNTPIAFEQWVQLRTGGALHDRTLWFAAFASDGDLAGVSLCSSYPDTGWVETLGVRREHRGRGLGKALLRRSFVELYSRGQRRVGLGVDADSLTGATRLYESAGMKADVTVDVWDLELD